MLWHLAEALQVPMHEEEKQLGDALVQAADALWLALGASDERYRALCHAAVHALNDDEALAGVMQALSTTDFETSQPESLALFRDTMGWLNAPVPVIKDLIELLEQTQIDILLTPNANLALTCPDYLAQSKTVAELHRLLSSALRPTMLQHGALLSPMEATIYHQPEPGAPPFVEVGAEVSVGQTIALLEAMKMYSELPSPVDGVVEAILVESGQGVKTGTPLFKIATQDISGVGTDDGLPQLASDGFQNHFCLL